MRRRTITVLDRQTLWDVAIREYGSVEGLFLLLRENPHLQGVDAPIVAGQQLTVRSLPVDADVQRFYHQRDLYPVTDVPAQFTCAGEGYGSFTSAGVAYLDVITSSGYVALRNAESGDVQVFGTGVELDVISGIAVAGTYCMWSSDEHGAQEGYITGIWEQAGYLTVMANAGYHNLSVLSLEGGSFVKLDMSNATSLQWVHISGNLAFTTMLLPDTQVPIYELVVQGAAMNVATVDRIANACDPAIPFGNLDLSGGTSASPSSASALNRGLLNDAGWLMTFN